MILVWIWVFGLGMSLGSFLNVLVFRLPRGKSLVRPGSRCPYCSEPIHWWDNVPLISYLVLRARCRSCGAAISVRYPLMELAGGITAMAAFLRWGLTPEALLGTLILLGFLAIALIDLDTFIISDSLCIIIALLGVGLLTASGHTSLVPRHLVAGLVGACFILTIILLSRGGMGFGDVKLAATMGIILGFRDLGVALFLGIVLGAAAALLLILTRRKGRGDAMPFGPFLAAGAIVTLLEGDAAVELYKQLVGLS